MQSSLKEIMNSSRARSNMYENDAGRKGRGLSRITDRRRMDPRAALGALAAAWRRDELLLSPREQTPRINRGVASGALEDQYGRIINTSGCVARRGRRGRQRE